MNKVIEQFMMEAIGLERDTRLCPQTKARLLYGVAGMADGYGRAMLDHAATKEYVSGLGPECIKTSYVIKAMAEKLLGYEKP